MKLGLNSGYSGQQMGVNMELILEAERAGFDSVWTAEAYGSDAIVPLAWIGALTKKIKLGTAIMQMPARTPAMTAMTAMTLDAMSGGRFILGLGPSGPQVVEGWHGVAYGKPLARTREYVAIVRRIWARAEPLTYEGEHYRIPYRGPDASGLGKPLRSIVHGRQIPIYLAAIGPKNTALAGEIADGWIPTLFSPEHVSQLRPLLQEGAERSGRSLDRFDIAPTVNVFITDDLKAARDAMRPFIALYVGGMGSRQQNFYNNLVKRYGFEREAETIQDLYLQGKREQAMAAIPDDLIDLVSLCGPQDHVRERIAVYRDAGVGTLGVTPLAFTKEDRLQQLRLVAELAA